MKKLLSCMMHGLFAQSMRGCLVLLLTTAAIGSAHADSYKMKIATIGMNDPQHDFLKKYKARIEAVTKGRIKAELYPGGQLGNVPRMIEALQLGTVEMFAVPPSFLKGVDTRFQVTAAPGLFRDFTHAAKTASDPKFRNYYLGLGVSKGIKGVSLWVYGPSSYATTKPVRKLADFRGLKIRVLATDLEQQIMSNLGATGVPMPMLDVLPALERGGIDGIRSNIAVMHTRKFWSITKFITLTNEQYIMLGVFVSGRFYNKLPKDLQAAIMSVARELEPEMLKVAVGYDNRAAKLWRDNGAEVIRLSAADQAKFMALAKKAADKVYSSQPKLKEAYDLYKSVAKKY